MPHEARQPKVGWSETRQLIRLDLEAYGLWLPGLRASWPAWVRFTYVLVKTPMFPANLLYRLQTWLYGGGLWFDRETIAVEVTSRDMQAHRSERLPRVRHDGRFLLR